MKSILFWSVLLIGLGFFSRIVPHPANLSPVLAIALIAGRTLRPMAGLAIILAVFVGSDLILGFYPGQLYVYGALVMALILGFRTRRSHDVFVLTSTALSGSSLFFVISNFGHWMSTTMYSKDLMGLVHCYIMALPFFWRSLAADFFFFAVLLLGQRLMLGAQSQSHAHLQARH